jgi:hypothetical protein
LYSANGLVIQQHRGHLHGGAQHHERFEHTAVLSMRCMVGRNIICLAAALRSIAALRWFFTAAYEVNCVVALYMDRDHSIEVNCVVSHNSRQRH